MLPGSLMASQGRSRSGAARLAGLARLPTPLIYGFCVASGVTVALWLLLLVPDIRCDPFIAESVPFCRRSVLEGVMENLFDWFLLALSLTVGTAAGIAAAILYRPLLWLAAHASLLYCGLRRATGAKCPEPLAYAELVRSFDESRMEMLRYGHVIVWIAWAVYWCAYLMAHLFHRIRGRARASAVRSRS